MFSWKWSKTLWQFPISNPKQILKNNTAVHQKTHFLPRESWVPITHRDTMCSPVTPHIQIFSGSTFQFSLIIESTLGYTETLVAQVFFSVISEWFLNANPFFLLREQKENMHVLEHFRISSQLCGWFRLNSGSLYFRSHSEPPICKIKVSQF